LGYSKHVESNIVVDSIRAAAHKYLSGSLLLIEQPWHF